eukprot:1383225-Amorphochlora_amoeboformis.AAC.2
MHLLQRHLNGPHVPTDVKGLSKSLKVKILPNIDINFRNIWPFAKIFSFPQHQQLHTVYLQADLKKQAQLDALHKKYRSEALLSELEASRKKDIQRMCRLRERLRSLPRTVQ